MKHLLKQLITLVLILMTSISAWAGVAIGGVYYSTTGNIENEIISSDDIEKDIAQLEENKFKVTIPLAPAVAFGGKRVVFMYSLAIGLIEIVEE